MDINNIEHNEFLSNHMFKMIVLEAPTLPELDKKLKNYKLIFVRALTNAYRISNLTIEKSISYYALPNGNYQSTLIINFNGMKKGNITEPEKTLQYLQHLELLQTKKEVSHRIAETDHSAKKVSIPQKFTIVVSQEEHIDEAISHKQREILEKLISNLNLTNISFYNFSKEKDCNAGQIKVSLDFRYEYRERKEQNKNNIGQEEPIL